MLSAVDLGFLVFHVSPSLADDPRAPPTSSGSTSTLPRGRGFRPQSRQAAHVVHGLLRPNSDITGYRQKRPATIILHIYTRLQPHFDSFPRARRRRAGQGSTSAAGQACVTAGLRGRNKISHQSSSTSTEDAAQEAAVVRRLVRPPPPRCTVSPRPLASHKINNNPPRPVHHRHRARPGWVGLGDPWAADERRPAGPRRRCSTWHARDRAAGLPDAPWPPVYPKHARRTVPGRTQSCQEALTAPFHHGHTVCDGAGRLESERQEPARLDLSAKRSGRGQRGVVADRGRSARRARQSPATAYLGGTRRTRAGRSRKQSATTWPRRCSGVEPERLAGR